MLYKKNTFATTIRKGDQTSHLRIIFNEENISKHCIDVNIQDSLNKESLKWIVRGKGDIM